MGSIGFSASSPAEFYAGANSTGTAAAPVYRTDKPADSTRYWVGGTGNWNDTNRWSTSSGGAGGADLPRSHDDVVFDSSSNATAYTATVNAITGGNRCKALTIAGPASGNVTLAGSTALFIHDDITVPATGLTRTYTGTTNLTGTGAGKTITTNGMQLNLNFLVNGVGAEWALADAFNSGSGSITVTNGSFDTANYNVTCGGLFATSNNTRTFNLGSSTIISFGLVNLGATETSRATLTFTAGTSQINLASNGATLSGNSQAFYNVSFTTTAITTATINGSNTFNNLTVAGRTSAGIATLQLTADQTINGTLTLSAGTNATMRTFVRSNNFGTTRTLTCAAVASLTDIDFRDITIVGAAAPVSGTRLGDCKGNTGITFAAGTDKYWNLAGGGNWSSTAWATSSGGAVSNDNLPLAQDTCLFEAGSPNSGSTITINDGYNIGTIDTSARTTNTMTLACSQSPSIYGNWINGTGVTLTGTGTLTFAGRGSQTITSAGRTFTQSFTIDTPSGSVTLQDAFETDRSNASALTLRIGTFDANGYNVTLSGSTGGVNLDDTTTTRTLAVGSGTWTIAGTTAWDALPSTGLTVTGTGTLKFTSASSKSFSGGNLDYSGITLDQAGAGQLTIADNNTLANITNTYSATGATTLNLGTTTQRVADFTATGTAGNVLTIQGSSATSPCTLIHTGAGDIDIDYVTITGVRAYQI
jgi:fibronectin-binding autotransporter adhesin